MATARHHDEFDVHAPLLPPDTVCPSALFLLERRRRLRQHVARLRRIAARIDRLRNGTRAASVAGSCLGAAGAVAAIVGLSLSPVTLGASLLASTVGLAVAAAGGAANVASDMSAALCGARQLKRVRVIARDSRELVQEVLLRLELLRREQAAAGHEGYGCTEGDDDAISLSDCVCFVLLFGAHDFLVPKTLEGASKDGQAVLRAKTHRLAQTLESCTRALDRICQRLLAGGKEQGGLRRESEPGSPSKNRATSPAGLWGAAARLRWGQR